MKQLYNFRIEKYTDTLIITKYSESRLQSKDRKESGIINVCRDSKSGSNEPVTDSKLSQMYAIRRKIRQYGLANEFDLFWTLTFDDRKINGLDYQLCRTRVQKWLRNMRDKYGKFDYLFIPEYHKSGRIHFHGLTGRLKPDLSEARNSKNNSLIRKNGKQIYNSQNWKYGFSTVSRIGDKDKATSYITKYITKELLNIPNLSHQPRYLISRGLKKPIIEYKACLEFDIDIFKPSLVIKKLGYNQEYQKEISIYRLKKIGEGKLYQENIINTKYTTNIHERGVEDEDYKP